VTAPGTTQNRLPRLLAGLHSDRPVRWEEHLERLGPPPRPDSGDARAELIAAVEASGLRGRGGAGFPLTTKMRAVASVRGPRIVVANGAEGEPASGKDDLLMARAPHLVLDGAVLAARAVGADEAIVCVKRRAQSAREAIDLAVREREQAGLDRVRISVAEVSSGYVAGEESALVNHLNGGPGKPTLVPPRPFERGVGALPTLIQNVETLANLALISRFGDAWFRELGTPEDPGSILITVSGSVATPAVYEVAAGTPLGNVIRAAGGPTEPLQALLVGGYSGSWFPVEAALKLELGHTALRAAGGTLGPGVVFALPDGACGVSETARIAGYLAHESSGQCGPCVHGLAAIADALEEISAGRAPPGTHEWVACWCTDVAGRGACHHPDGAARLVSSCLEMFAREIERHEQGRPCHPRSSMTALLPLPNAAPRLALEQP
jgi:NADH:ubiquinone oxidoreductase subunit F (NADH-binding)